SKSGVHRLINALVERGFIRRLPHRARALEVLRMPAAPTKRQKSNAQLSVVKGAFPIKRQAEEPAAADTIPVLGKIAAGTPIEAIQDEIDRCPVPQMLTAAGEHYILMVEGESMRDAGICDGDFAVIQRKSDATSGDIVVALVDGEEATLKRLRRHKDSIALEAANPDFETRIYPPERVSVQGRLVGLMRRYAN
ncbi:MAG: transcriptional repressor LexA, partial [Pseudomonadota bacterium]